jgi:hypothetical protein
MNKQIILDALAAQFATKQNEFLQYETAVYNPAVDNLNNEVREWFKSTLDVIVHDITYNNDHGIEITPFNNKWPGRINIRKKYSYSRNEDQNPFDISYSSSYGTVEHNNMFYLTVLGKVASNIELVIEKIENTWVETYRNIKKPYNNLSDELYKLEQEVNRVKQEIHENNREGYKAIGFEHSISSQLVCEITDYSIGNYELNIHPKRINLTTGRGRYDYVDVVAYRVVGQGKYNKVSLLIKAQPNHEWTDIEVKQDYFNDFVADVYQWETHGKQSSDESQTKRFNRYEGAKQTA